MELRIPFEVEFNLHEWIPDLGFNWETLHEVETAQNEMVNFGGEWPENESRSWEPLSKVRQRTLDVLSNYLSNKKVAVVCHEWVINSLTGLRPQLAETIEYTYKA
jgi:broad specificity phosphatase PhoE